MSDGADPFDHVEAQPRAIETLRAALDRDRLASAYLFEGPSGTGKAKTALALAERVIARAEGAEDRVTLSERIGRGLHPDVRVFPPREEGDRNLPVAVVRDEILPFAQFAPFEASDAFLVFPDADVSFPLHHPEGANAILKTLEEPRRGVHFVLLSSRPDRLLPTIRSRCQRVSFSRLPDATIDAILAREGVPEAARLIATALADGRADKALDLARTNEHGRSIAEERFELAVRADEAAASGRPGAVIDVAEEIGRRVDLLPTLEVLGAYYRDVARAALGLPDPGLAFRHEAARIRARGALVGAGRVSEAVTGLRAVEEALRVNANKELVLADWLFALGPVPMPPRLARRR